MTWILPTLSRSSYWLHKVDDEDDDVDYDYDDDDDDDEYDYVLKTQAEVMCAECPIAQVHMYTVCAQCRSTL